MEEGNKKGKDVKEISHVMHMCQLPTVKGICIYYKQGLIKTKQFKNSRRHRFFFYTDVFHLKAIVLAHSFGTSFWNSKPWSRFLTDL